MKKKIERICILILLLCLFLMAIPAGATSGSSWSAINSGLTDINGQKVFVTCLSIDKTSSNNIYAGTWGSGVFKSVNNGGYWNTINSGLSNMYIKSLVIAPTDSQTVYAVTSSSDSSSAIYRLFKSTNGGSTWLPVSGGLPTSTTGIAVAVDPTSSQTIYATTSNSGLLYKSTNGGSSWTSFNIGLTNLYVYSLHIDPTNTQTIYAVTSSGVIKTTNSSGSWSSVSNGLTNSSISTLVIDPDDSQTVYLGTSGGVVFKSTDGGNSWGAAIVVANTGIRSLAIDPFNNQNIYAGTDSAGAFYKSSNGGGSWYVENTGLPTGTSVTSLSIDPINHNNIYAVTAGNGVFKKGPPTISGTPDRSVTSNSSYSFRPWSTNATSFSINNMPKWARFDTTTGALTGIPTNVDAGTYSNITISATDGLVTVSLPAFSISVTATAWEQRFGFAQGVSALAIDPNTSSTLYVGTFGNGGVYKSGDGGATWTGVSSNGQWFPTNMSTMFIAIDPTKSQTVYAGSDLGGMYRSTDGGYSWSVIYVDSAKSSVNSLLFDPTNSQTIYAGTYTGVYKSTNGGSSWAQMIAEPIYSLAMSPTSGQIIYAGGYGLVYKTTNGGGSWSAILNVLEDNKIAPNIRALAVDLTNSETIYAGTDDSGAYDKGSVFRSTDGGGSWTTVVAGAVNTSVKALVADPSSDRVYAAIFGRGVSIFNGRGIPNDGMTTTRIYTLSVDPNNTQNVFAGTDVGVYQGFFPAARPTISGTPITAITAGKAYSFIPTSINATTFSIANKPSWASFNPTTGALSGTPSSADVGTFGDIVISATNVSGTASLPAFSVTVSLPMPTISGIPTIAIISGSAYSFTPTASNVASFTITNKPSWATFDPTTGALIGTPSISDAGSTSNIVISASNSTGTVSLPAFTITVTPAPDTTAPVVTRFTLPSISANLVVPVTTLTATDTVGVTGFLLTEKPDTPSPTANGWSRTAPSSFTFSTAGSKTLYAWAKDAAGNVSTSLSATVTVDTTGPTLTLSTLADGAVTNSATLNISGTVSDPDGVAGVTINNALVTMAADGSFSSAVTLVTGSNTITTVAVDDLGNQTRDIRTITLDNAAPVLTINSPADNTKTAQQFLTVTGTINEASTVSVTVNSGTPQLASISGTSFTEDVALAAGTNTIAVVATDLGNNSTMAKRTVTYDNAKPSLTVTNPAQDTTTAQNTLILTGTVSDALSSVTVTISVDGRTFSPTVTQGAFSQQLTFSAEGTHVVTVTATDQANNSVSVTRNIIYRLPKPHVTINAVTSPTTSTSVTIGGTMDAGAVVTVSCPTASVGQVTYPTPTTWQVAVTHMVIGTNTITAVATGTGGLTSDPASATLTVQSSPPTGDLDGSNQVEMADVMKAYQAVLGRVQLTAAELKNADVAPLGPDGKPKGDGVVDIADIVLLLRHLDGLANW